jgi:subtilisin family serine protease
MWVNLAEKNGQPGVDDDGNGFVDDIYGYDFSNNDGDPKDDHGHGSHVAGTIGAKGNNTLGVVGVNWNVKIMPVKFLSRGGSGTLENAVKAIDYATKMHARILSNSWGGGGFSQILEDSIKRANEAGILFVAAAGNDRANNDVSPHYPSSYDVPNVLSVAAIDNTGALAKFSCYGKTSVDVAAPGVNILSSTIGGYKTMSGTSMATPHVSGIAALVMSNEPTLTALQVKERIIATSRPLASLRGKMVSGGLANAYYALSNQPAPVDPTDPTNWAKLDISVSTAHPYLENTNQTFEVQAPNAKHFALYFEKFSTQRLYDTLRIYDKAGTLIATLSGNNDDTYSPVIEGDYAKLVFETDDSKNDYGFDIPRLAYEPNQQP